MKGRGRYPAAKKTVFDDIAFHSKKEAHRYGELKLLQLAGEISDLKLQPRYAIRIGGVAVKMRSARYPNGRHLTYVADFSYLDIRKDEIIIEDVKGHRTDVYKIKRALMEAMGYRILET